MSCPDPGTPDHGVKLGSTYTYGSAVSYQCLAGYTISGAARIECQANQQWTADVPSCNGKNPPQLLVLQYLAKHFSGFCAAWATRQSEYEVTVWHGNSLHIVGLFKGTYWCLVNSLHQGSVMWIFDVFFSLDEKGISDMDWFIICYSAVIIKVSDHKRDRYPWHYDCWADVVYLTACPLNTYKPGSNVDACSTCPAHTHTDDTASVARTQCLCDEGYRGPNGGPCECKY